MGETVWYERRAGEMDTASGIGVAHVSDTPHGEPGDTLLMGDLRIPDRCIVPNDAALGIYAGREMLIRDVHAIECPHPACRKNGHGVRMFVFDGALRCVECPRQGFLWCLA